MIVFVSLFPVIILYRYRNIYLKRFTETLGPTSNVVRYTSNRTSPLVTFVDWSTLLTERESYPCNKIQVLMYSLTNARRDISTLNKL